MCFRLKSIGEEAKIVSTRHECPSRVFGKGLAETLQNASGSTNRILGGNTNFAGKFFESGWMGTQLNQRKTTGSY